MSLVIDAAKEKSGGLSQKLIIMKTIPHIIFLCFVSHILNGQEVQPSQSLFKTISTMDSVVFGAFNKQDMPRFKSLFTNDLEWYQDNAGLIPYNSIFETFDKNFHNEFKLTRELVKGSLEVYPIKDYGAIEIGSHRFRHLENGKEIIGQFKFVMIWKETEEGWKISRVISFNH
jgi:hypothetical protein